MALKRFRSFVAFAACCALFAGCSASRPAEKAPEKAAERPTILRSPNERISVTGKSGETKTCELLIENVSQKPVKIMGAPSSCGCMAVISDLPHVIAPGETFKLRVQVGFDSAVNETIEQNVSLLVNVAGATPTFTIATRTVP